MGALMSASNTGTWIILYLAAGSKVLALSSNALVVVDVVLPAVLGLVLVGETGVGALKKLTVSISEVNWTQLSRMRRCDRVSSA